MYDFGKTFRKDIQGLRAIAILSVIIAHFKLGISGGFVGVDIFFVISGYLITLHLFKEAIDRKTISLLNFYAKRILRIIPALVVVILSTVLLSYLFLSPISLFDFTKDAFYAIISFVNYHFAYQQVDYFGSDIFNSPFLHYWSLSLEEQFYFIWPLIMLIIAKLFSKNLKRFQISLSVFLGAVIISGIFISYLYTPDYQPWTYFGLHARAWQLALGAIVAVNTGLFLLIPKKLSVLLSWLGFVGILSSFFLITDSTLYPGLWALLPTISTALVIGVGIKHNIFSSEYILSRPILQYFGKISYSLYLIHWPLIIIFAYQFSGNLSIVSKILIILLSIFLAHLLNKFVEERFRARDKIINLKKAYKIGFYMILGSLLITGSIINPTDWKESDSTKIDSLAVLENEVTEKIKEALETKVLSDSLSKKINSKNYRKNTEILYKQECLINNNPIKITDYLEVCESGDKESDKKIVLLGSSFAHQYLGLIENLSEKYGFKLYSYTIGRCGMWHHDSKIIEERGEPRRCQELAKLAIKEITNINPDLIIYSNSSNEILSKRYTELMNSLKNISNSVIVIRNDINTLVANKSQEDIYSIKCLSKYSNDIQKCTYDLYGIFEKKNNFIFENEKIRLDQKISELTIGENIKIVDITDLFCYEGKCPAVINDMSAYKSKGHVAHQYSMYLLDIIDQKLNLKQYLNSNHSIEKHTESIKDSLNISKIPDNVYKEITDLNHIKEQNYLTGCFDERYGVVNTLKIDSIIRENTNCILGDVDSEKKIVLMGDSYAHHWLGPVELLAEKYSYKLIHYSAANCKFKYYDKDIAIKDKEKEECSLFRKEVFKQIEEIEPDIIIYSDITKSNKKPKYFKDFMVKLKNLSKNVFWIQTDFLFADYEYSSNNPTACLIENRNDIQKCTLSTVYDSENRKLVEDYNLETQAAKDVGVHVLNLTDLFCYENKCPALINNISVYRKSHISNYYLMSIMNLIEDRFDLLKY